MLNVTELLTKRSPEVRKQIRDFEGYEIDEMGNVYCTRYEKERIIHSWVEINTGYRLVRIRKKKRGLSASEFTDLLLKRSYPIQTTYLM